MKIRQVNIRAFGKLRDRQISFGHGLNLIHAPNEAGKSTLLSFIAAALYGFARPGIRSRSLEDDYERLRPWHGSDYSGSLRYELSDGNLFEVFRDFSNHDLRVFDSTGSNIIDSFDADRTRERLFAEAHTGLDKETFKKTVYIDHGSSGELEEPSGIVHKLQEFAAAGAQAEGATAGEAVESLGSVLRSIGVREGASGTPLGSAATAVRDLEYELQAVNGRHQELADDLERAGDLRDEIDSLRHRREELDYAAKRARIAEISRTLDSITNLDTSIGQLTEQVAQIETVSDEVLAACSSIEAQLDQPLEVAVEKLSMESAPADMDAARELVARDRGTAESNSRVARTAVLAGALTAAGALVSLILGVAVSGIWLVLAAILAVCSVGGFIIWGKRSSAAREALSSTTDREQALTEKEEGARVSRTRLNEILTTVDVQDVSAVRELAERCRRLTNLRSRLSELEERRTTLTAGVEIPRLESSRKQLENELKSMVASRSELSQLPDMSRDEAEQEIRNIDSRISQSDSARAQLEGRAGAILSGCRNVGDIETDLEDARLKLEDVRERREAVDLAMSLISRLSRDVHEQYASKLSVLMNESISPITGKYGEVGFEENLRMNVRVPETGEWRPVDQLSWGTKEQFYVLLRVSLARLLSSSDEPMPVFLDDAFAHSDDDRLSRLCDFLAELSASHQVMIFTCREAQAQAAFAAADRMGAELVIIDL